MFNINRENVKIHIVDADNCIVSLEREKDGKKCLK